MSGYDGRGRKFPLTIVRGTDVAFQLTVTSAGSPVNMSAATITASIFTNAGVLDDTFTPTITGAGNNVVTLSLTDTETALLLSSTYRWSLVVTRGGDVRTWLAGTVRVTDSDEGGASTSGNVSVTVDDDVNIDIDVAVVGGAGGSSAAADITIVDTGGYYTATNVEAALAEVKQVADTAAGGGVTLEQVQDDLGNTSLVAGTGITKTYNDGAGTITIAVTGSTYQPLDSDLTTIAAANNGTVLAATTASFLTADESKLDGIEAGADVTDATNVAAAGAYMLSTAAVTVAGASDTLAAGDNGKVNLYTEAGLVTVTLANIATGFECVLVSLGAAGLNVATGGMSYANSFTPLKTIAQGEALYVKQTAASTWIILGGTAA
jgi:hypothetical protein